MTAPTYQTADDNCIIRGDGAELRGIAVEPMQPCEPSYPAPVRGNGTLMKPIGRMKRGLSLGTSLPRTNPVTA